MFCMAVNFTDSVRPRVAPVPVLHHFAGFSGEILPGNRKGLQGMMGIYARANLQCRPSEHRAGATMTTLPSVTSLAAWPSAAAEQHVEKQGMTMSSRWAEGDLVGAQFLAVR